MTPEQLGTEIGNAAAQAFNSLYDILGNSPQITDEIKQKVSNERVKAFEPLIPMIKQYHALGEEDASTAIQSFFIANLTGIDDYDTKIEKLSAVLDSIFEGDDKEFTMDSVSLFAVNAFMENSSPEDEKTKTLFKHVGL